MYLYIYFDPIRLVACPGDSVALGKTNTWKSAIVSSMQVSWSFYRFYTINFAFISFYYYYRLNVSRSKGSTNTQQRQRRRHGNERRNNVRALLRKVYLILFKIGDKFVCVFECSKRIFKMKKKNHWFHIIDYVFLVSSFMLNMDWKWMSIERIGYNNRTERTQILARKKLIEGVEDVD